MVGLTRLLLWTLVRQSASKNLRNTIYIGLSGLIAPSLDAMHVGAAKEMSKGGFKQLLIFVVATATKIHTICTTSV